MIINQSERFRRPAFTLIEILIAMSFLAAATVFAVKVHQSRVEYDRIAMDRLRQELQAENFAEELRGVAYGKLPEATAKMSAEPGVSIKLSTVDAESRSGQQVVVEIGGPDSTARHHFWRWESAP